MNKHFFSLFAMLMLACTIARAQNPVQFDGVAAEVGGTQITIADVMSEAREIIFASKVADLSSEVRRSVASAALTNLVNRQLILHHYEQGEGKIPDWYFNQRIEQLIDTAFKGDKQNLVRVLEERNLTFSVWRKRTIDDMICATMRSQFVEQNIKIRPIDIEARYQLNYANMKLDGPVQMSMIMLAVNNDPEKALSDAKILAESLRKKGNFAEIARKISLEKHASEGGSWGYIDPEEMLRKELADAIMPLGVGAISPPILVGEHVYLLRKDDERDSLDVPIEMVREQIEQELFREQSEIRYAEWLRDLAQKYTVRILSDQ